VRGGGWERKRRMGEKRMEKKEAKGRKKMGKEDENANKNSSRS
jgi:hypothetical protein